MPDRRSRYRAPGVGRSTVSTRTGQPAERARESSSRTKPRSLIMYSWNQGGVFTAAHTSSIEQMLTVDKQNGTPASAAARAALISHLLEIIPANATGPKITGSARD